MENEVRLIDANALNKRFDEREADDIELYGVHIAECFPADEAKEIVDQIPTIDPESLRPKGRWEYVDDGVLIGNGMHMECSECSVWKIDRQRTPYCPNCGADMREG